MEECCEESPRSNGNRTARLLDDVPDLIQSYGTSDFLDKLAVEALKPHLTTRLFERYYALFADTCARWLLFPMSRALDVFAAFARILPLAPHLEVFYHEYMDCNGQISSKSQLPSWLHSILDPKQTEHCPRTVQTGLLAIWRLLQFNTGIFHGRISMPTLQQLFEHEDCAIRLLSIRIFCQLSSAADLVLETTLDKFVGTTDMVSGDVDGKLMDYGFLLNLEEERLQTMRAVIGPSPNYRVLESESHNVLRTVLRYGDILLPRPRGPSQQASILVPTPNTFINQANIAHALLSSEPILLHGLPGAGKSCLIWDIAQELGFADRMVTLHLNEQTDAKMLIGMYSTGAQPGSFVWRPGVLTTAVKQGRWVVIEDLDRAPTEVLSVILPLIERRELTIANRGEIIRAHSDFRLFATLRTSLDVHGVENTHSFHMLGSRLWKRVNVRMPSQEELRMIVKGKFPILQQYLPRLLSVYDGVYMATSRLLRNKAQVGRPASPRDLFTWCRRLASILRTAGLVTGHESITDSMQYEMFMEAADCFTASLASESRRSIISLIGEEMHIDPHRVQHYIDGHVPRLEHQEAALVLGRTRLSVRNGNKRPAGNRRSPPFANTVHAKRLLEQLGACVNMTEPVLLVGETGIGKTTVVQQLANCLNVKLVAVNLSQQSEVGDLLGGYKPVNIRSLAIPLKDEFDDLFAATGISVSKNQKYIEQLAKCVTRSQWSKASRLWREAPKMFKAILKQLSTRGSGDERTEGSSSNKRRKLDSRLEALEKLGPRWDRFTVSLDQFDMQLSGGSKAFAFTFVEGNIVKAVRNGDWVLLDEINLASQDTLESIADLLSSGNGTSRFILLSETGEIEKIEAHPNFRIFGAMNPATDVGKKDLPAGIRSRFTEIYVDSPDANLDDLREVIRIYLSGTGRNDERAVDDVARLYMNTKQLAKEKRLVDGAGQVPHYSLRTLSRVLSYAVEIAPLYGLRRALYEGFAMGFLTLLDKSSEGLLVPLINHHLLDSQGNSRALLSQAPKHPDDGRSYVRFVNNKKDRQYWMLQGREATQAQPDYIITPFVERNLLNLVRATSTRRFPVLIQGPTSSGKTSMIEYLAKFSGNKFVRINNHEHTDLQEYLGTYISDTQGRLIFQEGLLVQALREGHWIVLDELNLAPTDVLEALNRLLDDNRELLIPETQELVRPHENFMLFATQNPAGLYGGRKTLSRAFRNRFLELHFDDIPEDELDFILERRSPNVAPSDCRRIVAVYKELSRLRQTSRMFEQKHSFATLRDLFRWTSRNADDREQLALNGFMLLAERVRDPDERQAVKEVIEKIMKVKIDTAALYDNADLAEMLAYNQSPTSHGVVWTKAMRRLFILVAHALRNNEPVLLVGETGCGKTTVCQMLAAAMGKQLHIVNAHQNTETGDLIGAQRPVRNRGAVLEGLTNDLKTALEYTTQAPIDSAGVEDLVSQYAKHPASEVARIPEELRTQIESTQARAKALFEWSDGALVQAMRSGDYFLLDELSLADDSVLERLNSVLETKRTILLAEKGIQDSFVRAVDGFQFFATMNPGGDYGKRELSPALRNRFTEIWVPMLTEQDDVLQIVEAKLHQSMLSHAKSMVQFAEWFSKSIRSSNSTSFSIRDMLAWIDFIKAQSSSDIHHAILHGAAMVYIDTIGANPAALLSTNSDTIADQRAKSLQHLSALLQHDVQSIYDEDVNLVASEQLLTIGQFSIPRRLGAANEPDFAFDAPTTKVNAMRIVRALQVNKPILLEGSPGVGKTTIIVALARACGRALTRINLSEQTDLMDLFGSDVPVEGEAAGHFAWRDAPFLQAMQRGDWVLLDEMNLASQSVLEGLNACLDHRGEVYVAELDQTFRRHPDFCVFAAQNPHQQGGGRKGLPASFVNRFTVVYADVFSITDLQMICKHSFPTASPDLITAIVNFVPSLERVVSLEHRFGAQGQPWEFNLRDALRWLGLLSSRAPMLAASEPSDFFDLIFKQRFRTDKDRDEVGLLYRKCFELQSPQRHMFHRLSSSGYQVGQALIPRDKLFQRVKFPGLDTQRLPTIESLMLCVQHSIPCILVGPSGCGKSSLIQHVAAATGSSVVTFAMNAEVDTMDLIGGFEQSDPLRTAGAFIAQLLARVEALAMSSLPRPIPRGVLELISLLQRNEQTTTALLEEVYALLRSLESTQSCLTDYATACKALLERPLTIDNAQFEWVDGILVDALLHGKWLVLDNANLCSSSVLDRLNSLLEPNGILSINEHCGTDGEPRIVRAHPDFRIFLTMDPRFGELSRAMRNRAIELFIPTDSESVEGSLRQGYHMVEKALMSQSPQVAAASLDNLSWQDMRKLPRYMNLVRQRHELEPIAKQEFLSACQDYVSIYTDGEHASLRKDTAEMLQALARAFGPLLSLEDAQVSARAFPWSYFVIYTDNLSKIVDTSASKLPSCARDTNT